MATLRHTPTDFAVPRNPGAAFPRVRRFYGLYVPTVTAYHASGAVNDTVIPSYAQYLSDAGAAGIFCNGTLGEGMYLSVEERMKTAEAWMKAIQNVKSSGSDRLKLIVQVGSQNLNDSKVLAAHASALGVAGISCHVPAWFTRGDVPTLVAWLGEVAASAPQTPFLFYHFPSLTNFPARCYEITASCEAHIPTFRGAKFTSRDYGDLCSCLSTWPDLDWMPACEDAFACSARLPVSGYISGLFNYLSPFYRQIWDLQQQLQQQQQQQTPSSSSGSASLEARLASLTTQACHLSEALDAAGAGPHSNSLGGVRYFVGLQLGVDVGPPRLPNVPLRPDQRPALRQALLQVGFDVKQQ